MAKRFFYVCAGLFLVALTYHLGARSAGAQAPANPIVACGPLDSYGSYQLAVTANGDTYLHYGIGGSDPWTYKGNIFSGGAVPTSPQTFGQIKDRYRK